jgi:hypothetical protein
MDLFNVSYAVIVISGSANRQFYQQILTLGTNVKYAMDAMKNYGIISHPFSVVMSPSIAQFPFFILHNIIAIERAH